MMNKKNTIRLTESELKNIISESVQRILNESHPYPHWIYIVCDGSSYYGIYATDLDDELNNGAEIVKGPFKQWDDRVDAMIEQLNDELNGTSMYR